MKNKVRVLKTVFDELMKSVKLKFAHQVSKAGLKMPEGVGARFYGFAKDVPEKEANLTDMLLSAHDNPTLQAFIKSNGLSSLSNKHLYNLNRDFARKGPKDSVRVEERVMDLLSIYLGFASFQDFYQTAHGILHPTREVQAKVLNLKENELSAFDLASHYVGFYYSYEDRMRKTLRFKVNFYNLTERGYPAELSGIHDEDLEGVPIVYSGFLKEKPSCSFTELAAEDERPFVLVGYKETHLATQDMRFIRCAATGVSQYRHPFSFEVLLVKADDDHKLLSDQQIIPFYEQVSYIDYYLQVQRRNFRVPARPIQSMGEIKARGNKANMVQGVVGRYRVFTISGKDGLVQHIYEMKKDFRSTLYVKSTNPNHREQPCMISISENRTKLCIAAHVKEGISVVTYAIFDIVPEVVKEIKLLPGVFCGIGNEAGTYGSGKIAVWKDKHAKDPGPVSHAQLKKLAKDNPELRKGLLATLCSEVYLSANTRKAQKVEELRNLLEGLA